MGSSLAPQQRTVGNPSPLSPSLPQCLRCRCLHPPLVKTENILLQLWPFLTRPLSAQGKLAGSAPQQLASSAAAGAGGGLMWSVDTDLVCPDTAVPLLNGEKRLRISNRNKNRFSEAFRAVILPTPWLWRPRFLVCRGGVEARPVHPPCRLQVRPGGRAAYPDEQGALCLRRAGWVHRLGLPSGVSSGDLYQVGLQPSSYR